MYLQGASDNTYTYREHQTKLLPIGRIIKPLYLQEASDNPYTYREDQTTLIPTGASDNTYTYIPIGSIRQPLFLQGASKSRSSGQHTLQHESSDNTFIYSAHKISLLYLPGAELATENAATVQGEAMHGPEITQKGARDKTTGSNRCLREQQTFRE